MAREGDGRRDMVEVEVWSLSAHAHLWSRGGGGQQPGCSRRKRGGKVGGVGSCGRPPWLSPVRTSLYQQ